MTLRSIMINSGVQDGLCWRKTGALLYVYVCVHVCGYQQKDYLHFDSSNTYFLCVWILICSIVISSGGPASCFWTFLNKSFLCCFFLTEPQWVTLGSRSRVNCSRMDSPKVLPNLGTPLLVACILLRTGREWVFIGRCKQKLWLCYQRLLMHPWGQKLGCHRMSSNGLPWQEVCTFTHPYCTHKGMARSTGRVALPKHLDCV